ncbi:MAG: FdhF/YdeP family oxidoreductase, partial [Pseudomonadota bacterium]
TNNFPDCSNMCHEASGVALTEAIGIGKGTVKLEDFEKADAIFVTGQNPGTNHPRMLKDLREATERGARVVVLNTLKEKGLHRFADPQNKVEMITGGSEATSTDYFRPRLGGDMAVFRGMAKVVFAADDAARAAGQSPVLDEAFIATHTNGLEDYRAAVDATPWDEIEDQSGLSKAEIEAAADIYLNAKNVIFTWAMGVTQHRHSVYTIREIANFAMLRGHLGRPGAGLCPVRGHSNVQGDRTVGINEKAPAALIDAMEQELGVPMPRDRGHNTLEAIGAMMSGEAKAFVALGGNFARAVPDSPLIAKAMMGLDLTVNIATKLNHGHLLHGKTSYLLPCLGRTEIDRNDRGEKQIVTVEDSMSMVHGSGGINLPASKELRSEVRIIAGIAKATVGNGTVDWDALGNDNELIRDMIARVLPIFGDYNAQVRQPRGYYLRNSAAALEWKTANGKANFSDCALPESTEWQQTKADDQRFVLQTFRSHDQYNTTIYGMDDRYRGVYGARNVIFIHPDDIAALGAKPGDLVDAIADYDDGIDRVATGFRLTAYDIPRGCVAGYYPELNVLVPHHSYGEKSYTPASKSIMVRLDLEGRNE